MGAPAGDSEREAWEREAWRREREQRLLVLAAGQQAAESELATSARKVKQVLNFQRSADGSPARKGEEERTAAAKAQAAAEAEAAAAEAKAEDEENLV